MNMYLLHTRGLIQMSKHLFFYHIIGITGHCRYDTIFLLRYYLKTFLKTFKMYTWKPFIFWRQLRVVSLVIWPNHLLISSYVHPSFKSSSRYPASESDFTYKTPLPVQSFYTLYKTVRWWNWFLTILKLSIFYFQ